MKTLLIRAIIPLCAVLGTVQTVMGQDETSSLPATAQSPDYHFKLTTDPTGLTRFFYAIYPNDQRSILNTRGTRIAEFNADIESVVVNPSGLNFTVITSGKKGTAYVASTYEQDEIKFKFNRKKFGQPRSAAYTPDALNLLIATDTTLYVLDARKFKPKGTMKLNHPARLMKLSGNAYHLATANQGEVTVYNYEDKTVRHHWNFESPVTDLQFSPDDTELAITCGDGSVNIYDTRSFTIKNSLENVGDALSSSYNPDGKYMAVAQSPHSIVVVNLLEPETDREAISVPAGNVREVVFLPNVKKETLLAYTTQRAVDIRNMKDLAPYYSKLVDDEVNRRLNEWLKMMPDETLEEYQARVNDESRARQRRMLEDEIATGFAPDMLTMAEITLGQYDKRHELLEVNFNNMPSIYLPVSNEDIEAFHSAGDLQFTNAKYTVGNNDRFELIYAEVVNSADGKTYIYNNIDRVALNFMANEPEEEVSIELIKQQQMEEIKLRELQQQIVEEAKSRNVISDHTGITVNTEVVPDYDANGNRILNYKVNYTYEVEPEFTAREDFGPGKYHINESGAAQSMLEIVRKSIDGELARYVKEGKKVNVRISGTADSSPIVGRIIYDGSYGAFEDEPAYNNGELTTITVMPKGRITENKQLAFLRAQGVKQYLEENIKELQQMKSNYRIDINVAEGKGSQFRRITTELTFVDAF